MLTPQTLSDLNKAFDGAPGGFVIVDSGRPRFAVLDYQTYQAMSKKTENRPKKNILVTGGAGYIGSITVRVLLERGYNCVVYDNLSTGLRERVEGVKLVVGDLADQALLEKTLREEKIDAVIHFAASIEVEESVRNPAKYFENNVTNGLRLLNAMLAAGVADLVFSSSAAVYGEPVSVPIGENATCLPTNPYGETKLQFERILRWYAEGYGMRSVTLRYFNAAGACPGFGLGYKLDGATHLIPRVLDVAAGQKPEIEVYGQDYPTPDGTCVRDYVHVLDLAGAHVAALEKLTSLNGAVVYNVGTGAGNSVLEVIEAAMEVTGKMIPMKAMPRREGDPARLAADSLRLQSETAWRPEHDLRSILQSSWDWHQTQI